jgi:predicted MFS family arabinose efflux permease
MGRARVLGGFAAFGLCWGAWGAVLPAVQSGAGVDDGELGAALLLIGAGAVVAMRLAGSALDRAPRRGLPLALALLAVAAIPPGIVDSMAGLCAALLALGAASGAADVAINAEGVRSEQASRRPVLSLAHGIFSASVIGGALLAGALRELGASAGVVLATVAALIAAIAIALTWARPPDGEPVPRGRLRGVPRPLLVLGLLCALAFFVENAWQSWGAIYLSDDLDASPLAAALAPALFAAAAASARFASHGLLERLGVLTLLRGGAFLGALGSLLASSASAAGPALVGVVIAGGGISICAPILLSLAGSASNPGARAAAVSVVTTIAYLGFVVGPAIVGLLAEAGTLRFSLAAVAAPALALGALATTAVRAPELVPPRG